MSSGSSLPAPPSGANYNDEQIEQLKKVPFLNFVLRPIAQVVINASVLEFDIVEISKPTNNTFHASIRGLISNAGPLPAKITFQKPITLLWRNRKLASMRLPQLRTAGMNGAPLDMQVTGQVLDPDALADNTAFIMNNENFEWEVMCEHLDIVVMGISIVGLKMRKTLPLKGMNAFRGSVTVNSWDLPADEPDGITLVSNFGILNPSAIGMTGEKMVFNVLYKEFVVGRLYIENQPIKPFTRNVFDLKGVFLPQKTQEGRAIMSEMFSNYVSGVHNPVSAVGVEVYGPEGRVDWLSSAVQRLRFDVVIPSPKRLQVISDISMKDQSLVFSPEAPYAPLSESKQSIVTLKLPFNFLVDVKHVDASLNLVEGQDVVAEFAKVSTPTTTTPSPGGGTLVIGYPPTKMNVLKPELFHKFISEVTLRETAQFELQGIIDSEIECGVGALQVRGMKYTVPIAVKGLAGLRSTAQASAVVWEKDWSLGCKFKISNQGQISVKCGEIKLDLYYNDEKIGVCTIPDLCVQSGEAIIDTNSRIELGSGLREFAKVWASPDSVVELVARGNKDSTQIESLKSTVEQFVLPMKIARTWQGVTSSFPAELKSILN
ncbi:uncharacterized protein VTP21DRAFT_3098 [Calcarisporiella thermophila]|uniref:uncharacterized protein n=1 Tax=Calcarisporiella thermophila TaxID=911321 RepID=UPI003744ADEB